MKNEVVVEGNLVRDPLLHTSKSGNKFVTGSIAYNDKYKKGDEQVKDTSFFDFIMFGDAAETVAALTKGALVHIEGSLRQRTWEDKEGAKRTAINIVAWLVEPLQTATKRQPPVQREVKTEEFTDDVPF